MGWARLLKRVFDIDLEHCPQCGGEFKIIAAIEEPAVVGRILTHLGLPARARAWRSECVETGLDAPAQRPANPRDLPLLGLAIQSRMKKKVV